MYFHPVDPFPRSLTSITLCSCELPLLVQRAIELLGASGRRFELELIDEPPPVLADPDLVAIALAHLIQPDQDPRGRGAPVLVRAYAVPGGVELCVLNAPAASTGAQAVARDLLAVHGSELELLELDCAGSTFRFRLPAAQRHSPRHAELALPGV